VAAYLDGVTGFSGTLTVEPGVGAPLVHPATRAYVPLTRGRAASLAADLRAAGFDVREADVRSGFAATGLLESMWLRYAVARRHPRGPAH
jgi:hypothetical protein